MDGRDSVMDKVGKRLRAGIDKMMGPQQSHPAPAPQFVPPTYRVPQPPEGQPVYVYAGGHPPQQWGGPPPPQQQQQGVWAPAPVYAPPGPPQYGAPVYVYPYNAAGAPPQYGAPAGYAPQPQHSAPLYATAPYHSIAAPPPGAYPPHSTPANAAGAPPAQHSYPSVSSATAPVGGASAAAVEAPGAASAPVPSTAAQPRASCEGSAASRETTQTASTTWPGQTASPPGAAPEALQPAGVRPNGAVTTPLPSTSGTWDSRYPEPRPQASNSTASMPFAAPPGGAQPHAQYYSHAGSYPGGPPPQAATLPLQAGAPGAAVYPYHGYHGHPAYPPPAGVSAPIAVAPPLYEGPRPPVYYPPPPSAAPRVSDAARPDANNNTHSSTASERPSRISAPPGAADASSAPLKSPSHGGSAPLDTTAGSTGPSAAVPRPSDSCAAAAGAQPSRVLQVQDTLARLDLDTHLMDGYTQGTHVSLQAEGVTSGGTSGAAGTPGSLAHRVVAGARHVNDVDFLQRQLDDLHRKEVLLLDRYRLLSAAHRRVGGQGVVQFATFRGDPEKKFALKFFLDKTAFQTERSQYENQLLRSILPPVDDVVNDGDSRVVISLGRPLPPMVVIEKGESLDEWARRCQPDFATSMQIVNHLVSRVAELHRLKLVHRDLKPGNTIQLPSRNAWTLIDFGSAAEIGSRVPLSFSLAYAAPETMMAYFLGRTHVIAEPACDVWAIGVMAFELFTRTRVFACSRETIEETMKGRLPLPWEDTDSPECKAKLRMLGFMKDEILGMLRRAPKERLTLQYVESKWRTFLQPEHTTVE